MPANNTAYRDELSAARERIRELEEKLTAAERPAAEIAEEWLSALRAERAKLIDAARKPVPLWTWLVVAAFFSAFLGVGIFGLVQLLAVRAPLFAAIFPMVPFLFLFPVAAWSLARQPQIRIRALAPKLAAIDAKIEDVRRTASMIAKVGAHGAIDSRDGIRVALSEGVDSETEDPGGGHAESVESRRERSR